MLIVDAHLDLSWNALQWNRDLLQPVSVLRQQDQPTTPTVTLPELRRGRFALVFATLLARSTGTQVSHIDFGSPAQAYGVAHGQLAYYRALEKQGHIRIITDSSALKSHIAEWEQWETTPDQPQPPLGFVITMEGADPILEPAQLEQWWQDGLRLLGPTHYGTGRYAGGTGCELGLTELGRPLLAEMQRLGVVLDVTHFSDTSFWQALEVYEGPVLASHQNVRALVPHQRQFSDDQLKAVIERDGVIGAAFDIWMLQPGWQKGYSNAAVTLENVVNHIDYVCQLAGNTRHSAIGTDLDGGFGWEQSPHDMDTIADLQRIPDLLAARGYMQEDIAAIMHGNWLRLLYNAWGE
ncbi:MAG: dipeptidase [Anaerolineae bacterium]|nr:dipeptidase [Anaerolineae bacterium]